MHTKTPPVSTLSLTCSILVTQAASYLQTYHFISLPLTSGCHSEGMGKPERGLRTCLVARIVCTSSAWAHRCCAACQSLGVTWPTRIENASLVLIEGLFWGLLPFCSICQNFSIWHPWLYPLKWRMGPWESESLSCMTRPPRCGALPDHMVVTKRSLCGHALQTLGAYLCVNNLSFYISAGINILCPVYYLLSIASYFLSQMTLNLHI